MNHGQSSPSPTIRFFTNEHLLAGFRIFATCALGIVVFFVLRLVSLQDETNRQMDMFRAAIQIQVSDIKIEVARNTANTSANIAAIHGRMDAQSRRMDGFDTDMREVNKKVYEWRGAPR